MQQYHIYYRCLHCGYVFAKIVDPNEPKFTRIHEYPSPVWFICSRCNKFAKHEPVARDIYSKDTEY